MTSQRTPSKASEKIQKRRELRRARLQNARRQGPSTTRYWLIAAAVLAVGLFAFWFLNQSSSAVADVRSFADQGRDHIAQGATHPAYNSAPPTSGWHYANWETRTGLHREPIPDEVQVHNLEHGDIMIQYNCECPDLVSKLDASFGRDRQVLIAPYPKMQHRLSLTAWTKQLVLEDFDETKIRSFVNAYRNKGPERLTDN